MASKQIQAAVKAFEMAAAQVKKNLSIMMQVRQDIALFSGVDALTDEDMRAANSHQTKEEFAIHFNALASVESTITARANGNPSIVDLITFAARPQN